MKKALVLLLLIFTQLAGVAMENKIKFDKETYNLSNSGNNEYNYYLGNETEKNWTSRITIKNLPDESNKTELAAEYAHQIQSEIPGASVLVYPDAATVGYITYPKGKEYYEYSTLVFEKNKNKGLYSFQYSKRFYADKNGGVEGARKAAINFAENNNKKYMEMINETAPKIKVD